MRRAAVLAAIVIAAAAAARQTPPPFAPVGPLQKVRNNLYMIPGQGGNTAVFVTRTGVVLVDTKTEGNGQAILDRVAAVSDVPVTMIINTHAHFDHTGSNEFFSPMVEVVTHENTRASMATDPAVNERPQAMPDRTFRDRLTIGRGPDQIDLYHFGPAHTAGDAIVVFPAVRAMHTGDLYAWKGPPLVDRSTGGSALAYADALERAVKGIRGVDTVIPGHADVTTWAEFVEFAELSRAMTSAATAAHRAGRAAQQAGAALTLPAKFDEYVADRTVPGLEILGTKRERAREHGAAIVEELGTR